ncbi:hypothetical protein AB9X29_003719 [Vibrio vulnificus]
MFDVIICEKASQGRQVAAVRGASVARKGYIEGAGCIVTWGVGHLLELLLPEEYDPKYKNWSIEDLPIIPSPMKRKPKSSTRQQLTVIKNLLSKAKAGRVIIATDGDREGEAIGRHILDYCRYKENNVYRAWVTSTDEQSIREAFINLHPIKRTEGHFNAAVARDEYDWLLGMNISRVLGCMRPRAEKNTFRVSYGRVQSATVAMAIHREKAIRQFVPDKHYGVTATFSSQGCQFKADWQINDELTNADGRLTNRSDAQAIVDFVRAANVVVVECNYDRTRESAPNPFKLSDLIKESARYKLDPVAMTAALQRLYEPPLSLVTYPRTDCPYLPTSMLSWVPEIFSHLLKNGYADEISICDQKKVSNCWNDKKLEGSSHHAIIPTRKSAEGCELNAEEKIVYDIICRRFLQQFAPDAEDAKSKIVAAVGQIEFKATGKSELFSGWRALDLKSKEKAVTNLPKVSVGEVLGTVDAVVIEKITQPPKRFTLASLIEEMGKANKYCVDERLKKVLKDGDGIGTEATRVNIVAELKNKKQIRVNKSGEIEVPSDVMAFFENNLPAQLMAVEMTATTEILLNAVESGELTLDDFRKSQRQFIADTVASLIENRGF